MRFVFLMKLLVSNNFETIVFLLSRRIELDQLRNLPTGQVQGEDELGKG